MSYSQTNADRRLEIIVFDTNLPFLDLRRFLETAMEHGRTYGFVLLSGNAEDR